MYVGTCSKCIYGLKCPCENSLNSAACLIIAMDGKPKQTNADRIRAMSDEELLDFLCSIQTYDEVGAMTIENGSTLCSVTDVENWLQSEVEEL